MSYYKSYTTKIIETPTYLEVYEYELPIIYDRPPKEPENPRNLDFLRIEKIRTPFEKMDFTQKSESLKRRERHMKNQRWEVARLVDCNYDSQTKFVTLTFKENLKNIEIANNEFKNFIQRLNTYLYHTKKAMLHYLATWELQKRGAVHYHAIFFGLPYIRKKELQEIWKNGFIKINQVDVDSKANRGLYVSKYFAKDLETKDKSKKSFFKSQNLKKPSVKKVKTPPDFGEKEVLYSKNYTRIEPKFRGFNNDGSKNIEFVENHIKYTKIKRNTDEK